MVRMGKTRNAEIIFVEKTEKLVNNIFLFGDKEAECS
jgi:hypothetical protein